MKTKLAATGGAAPQTYVDDVFSTYLYTGTGAAQTITNGIDLAGKGGLVWIKSRSAAAYNCLFDTARGANNVLWSNTTNAQVTYSSPFALTAFNSNGFNLNAEPDVNQNTTTYASWTFRKAAKFFDVVTYTGDGVNGRSIAHNLGIAPGMIITKKTSGAAGWVVNPKGGEALFLNDTSASSIGNLTGGYANCLAATDTFYTVNEYGASITNVNQAGQTYVAYLFAHDTAADGIIQCGSFTTDASGGFDVNLGWEPQFILIKSSGGTGSWYMLDAMRGMSVTGTNGTDQRLYANTSAAEAGDGVCWPTSTGFKAVSSLALSTTHIYMAIRRPNKPPTSGTQVFSPVAYGGSIVAQTVSTTITPDSVLTLATLGTSLQHYFNDRLRGATKTLASTSTAAEATTTTAALNKFDLMGGFGFAVDSNQNNWVAHAFKRAPGFFDVVCYTGTSTFNRTVTHNLTVVPELIFFKNRSGVASWLVQCSYFPSVTNYYASLNSSSAASASSLSWLTPTTTAFGFGDALWDSTNVNASGSTYVAYLFATLAGISKVGSYTGNGTSQNINCGFAAGARFILIKCTSTTGDWYVWDSARGIVSANDPHLSLNTTAAEVTTDDSVDPYAAGFTVNQVAATNINVSSATYIFLAIA